MKTTPLESWVSGKIGNAELPLTREKIERYQLIKLQETLTWAAGRSSFYRERFADLDATGLRSIEDLQCLPFTTAEDVKRNPLPFLCVSQGEISRVVTLKSSGTTGESKRIYFTGGDQELTVDFFRAGMSTLVSHGSRVLILLPGERPGSVGDLLAVGLRRLGAHAVAYGPVRTCTHALEAMHREQIDTLVGIPVQILALARHSKGKAPPKSVLLSTDHVPAAISGELKRTWGCEVYTHYGMTEMGYGGGVECEARYGYHMREADLLFEIVDPRTSVPLEEGRTGEVVFTTLTRRGMPLIRYRTGDLGRFRREPCPCGTVLKTMEQVKGRITNQVEVEPGVLLTMADLDEALFPIRDLIDFTAELTWEDDRSHLRLIAFFLDGSCMQSGRQRINDISEALNSVSSLQSCARRGKLRITVALREGHCGASSGSTKRTIIDKRVGERHHVHL